MMEAELQKMGQGAAKKVATGNRRGGRMMLGARVSSNAQTECVTVVDGAVLRGKARIEALLKNLTEQVAKREEAQEQGQLQHDIFGYNVFTVYCGRDVAA